MNNGTLKARDIDYNNRVTSANVPTIDEFSPPRVSHIRFFPSSTHAPKSAQRSIPAAAIAG
jgi:hypothetical protein